MSGTVELPGEVRLVVTGHTPEGKAVVVKDEGVPQWGQRAAGYRTHKLWGADDATAALRYPDDGRQGHFDEPAPEVGVCDSSWCWCFPTATRRLRKMPRPPVTRIPK
jgi:hypothetical protein